MIIVFHQNNKVVSIELNDKKIEVTTVVISKALLILAQEYPNENLVWCNVECKPNLNIAVIPELLHHKKILVSYNACSSEYLLDAIGYIEESIFTTVNKQVSYPTWRMSSWVGAVSATFLLTVQKTIIKDTDFDYFLKSLGKLAMPLGLFCYSEPRLLVNKEEIVNNDKKQNLYILFRFAKQHYKKRWVLLLFLNLLLYEKRIAIFPVLYSLFFKKRKLSKHKVGVIHVQSFLHLIEQKTMDVIIPTIGRKKYLHDVLKDLSQQTHLPKNVIIVEQNPIIGSVSELDFLKTEKWPFTIKHTFTHQTGACNARNLALDEVISEWVFFADDDVRFDKYLIENALKGASQYGINALITSCLKPNEVQNYNVLHQTGIFGSGFSFVTTNALKNVRFDMALEFGYGEDTDFGIQLRNKGVDVIYFPDLKITHLKAPMGGFRIQKKKQWEDDEIQPKPSPTLMYLKRKHFFAEQINGYKTVLFFKTNKKKVLIKPWALYKNFKSSWDRSVFWSEKLKENK